MYYTSLKHVTLDDVVNQSYIPLEIVHPIISNLIPVSIWPTGTLRFIRMLVMSVDLFICESKSSVSFHDFTLRSLGEILLIAMNSRQCFTVWISCANNLNLDSRNVLF